jgi:hypothetical protein
LTMRSAVIAVVFAGLAFAWNDARSSPQAAQPGPDSAGRFAWVDVYVTSDQPLAAWQLELSSTGAAFSIVGVEGGEHAAFAQPPFYDPAALNQGRIILAAFSTATELPVGKTRVARVHVLIPGEAPAYRLDLTVAAAADGAPLAAQASFQEGTAP